MATNAVGLLLISGNAVTEFGSGTSMRLVAGLVLVLLTLAPGSASAQDRATTCGPLAERGRAWLECCNQSFARNPTRAMSRRARLRSIERCVRNRLRNS